MAAFTVPCPKSSSLARIGSSAQHSKRNVGKISFSLTDSYSFGFQCSKRKQLPAMELKAKLNEVTTEKPSNSGFTDVKSSATVSIEGNGSAGKLNSHETSPDASSISAFMGQISDLVKLVDAKDIVELQLKQMDCEITIRKKEAVQQSHPAASMVTIPTPVSHSMLPSQLSPAPVPAPLPSSVDPAPPAAIATPVAAKQSSSSHPPLKCPMAGTFYRSPAPGEPPFVKVGDKVQKGQVVCIIEAMKLMNEIEADQTGTIAEISVEDGKPVSVDTPLFVIAP